MTDQGILHKTESFVTTLTIFSNLNMLMVVATHSWIQPTRGNPWKWLDFSFKIIKIRQVNQRPWRRTCGSVGFEQSCKHGVKLIYSLGTAIQQICLSEYFEFNMYLGS